MAHSKDFILRRDGYRCGYCGEVANTVDHLIPQSYRKNDRPENLMAACRVCNNLGSNFIFATFEEKREYILRKRAGSRKYPLTTRMATEWLNNRLK